MLRVAVAPRSIVRIAPIISTLLVTTTIAAAQPGAPQPYPQPEPPMPQPQPYAPQPYAPQPQPYAPQPGYPPQQPGYPPQQGYPQQYPQQPVYPGYGPQVQITPEEQELLAQGEISDGQHLGGAAVAFFFGFGAGQAVQGRWSDKGWIFTLGEVATITMMIYGAVNLVSNDCGYYDNYCDGYDTNNDDSAEAMLIVGALGFAAFRVWEVIDAIAGPSSHNARVRELRVRTGQYPRYYGLKPFVAPARDQGMTAGVTFSF